MNDKQVVTSHAIQHSLQTTPLPHIHTHTSQTLGLDNRKQKNQVYDSCLAPLLSDHPIWGPVLKTQLAILPPGEVFTLENG